MLNSASYMKESPLPTVKSEVLGQYATNLYTEIETLFTEDPGSYDGNFYFQECENLIEELDANSKAALLEYQETWKEFHELKIATTSSEKNIFKFVEQGETFKIIPLLQQNPDLAKNTTVLGNNIIHLLIKKNNLVDIQELLGEKELRSLLIMKNIKDQTPLQLAKHLGQEEISVYLRNFQRDNGLSYLAALPFAGMLGGPMVGRKS
jgi:hypothetical protein